MEAETHGRLAASHPQHKRPQPRKRGHRADCQTQLRARPDDVGGCTGDGDPPACSAEGPPQPREAPLENENSIPSTSSRPMLRSIAGAASSVGQLVTTSLPDWLAENPYCSRMLTAARAALGVVNEIRMVCLGNRGMVLFLPGVCRRTSSPPGSGATAASKIGTGVRCALTDGDWLCSRS